MFKIKRHYFIMKLVVQREFTPLMPTYSFNFSFPSSVANPIYLGNAQFF